MASGMVPPEMELWLRARRDTLNARYEQVRRNWPGLDADALLRHTALWLPPLLTGRAGDPPTSQAQLWALLDALQEALLLHSARGNLGNSPGLRLLYERGFVALRPWLLQQPSLVSRLATAVEKLGEERGLRWAERLPQLAGALGARAPAPQLLDAGALLAWRLGEARLRQAVLLKAQILPMAALSAALAVSLAQAPEALAALDRDAWHVPGTATPQGWHALPPAGAFSGFGGAFDQPPVVLAGGTKHQLRVRVGGRHFAVFCDVFGSTAVPCADPGWPACTELRLVVPGHEPRLEALTAAATGLAMVDGILAVTVADSHHLFLYAQGGP